MKVEMAFLGRPGMAVLALAGPVLVVSVDLKQI